MENYTNTDGHRPTTPPYPDSYPIRALPLYASAPGPAGGSRAAGDALGADVGIFAVMVAASFAQLSGGEGALAGSRSLERGFSECAPLAGHPLELFQVRAGYVEPPANLPGACNVLTRTSALCFVSSRKRSSSSPPGDQGALPNPSAHFPQRTLGVVPSWLTSRLAMLGGLVLLRVRESKAFPESKPRSNPQC